MTLERGDEQVPFAEAATELLDAIMETAKVLDAAHSCFEYSSAVYAQQAKVDDSALTPSGQIMRMVSSGDDFIDIASEQARTHQIHFASISDNEELNAELKAAAKSSLEQQASLEAQDRLSFDDFLTQYNNS